MKYSNTGPIIRDSGDFRFNENVLILIIYIYFAGYCKRENWKEG